MKCITFKGGITMVKKGLITGITILLFVLVISYLTGIWSFVYYVSGGIGLLSILLSLDFLIYSLGNKKTTSSEKGTYKSRLEDSKRFISIAIPNILAVFIYLIS